MPSMMVEAAAAVTRDQEHVPNSRLCSGRLITSQ
jgi:hypothetical protein